MYFTYVNVELLFLIYDNKQCLCVRYVLRLSEKK